MCGTRVDDGTSKSNSESATEATIGTAFDAQEKAPFFSNSSRSPKKPKKKGSIFKRIFMVVGILFALLVVIGIFAPSDSGSTSETNSSDNKETVKLKESESNTEVQAESGAETTEETTLETTEETTLEATAETATGTTNPASDAKTTVTKKQNINAEIYYGSRRSTKTYVSKYAGDPYNGDSSYDYMFNWEWPETFKREREEIFGLLKELDNYVIGTEEEVIRDGFQFLEHKSDNSFQISLEGPSYLYYGGMKGQIPDGKGVLFYPGGFIESYSEGTENVLYPVFAGTFKEGSIKGYGIDFGWLKYPEYRNIISEGYFDDTINNGEISYYGPMYGDGITYYEHRCDTDFHADIFEPVIITNRIMNKPSVHFEGYFVNSEPTDHVSVFGINKLTKHEYDNNLGKYRYIDLPAPLKDPGDVSGRSCYGWLLCDGAYQDGKIREGTYYNPDGTIFVGSFFDASEQLHADSDGNLKYVSFDGEGKLYDANGVLRFEGTIESANNPPYKNGTLYDETGTLMGTYKRYEFTWAEGYTPPVSTQTTEKAEKQDTDETWKTYYSKYPLESCIPEDPITAEFTEFDYPLLHILSIDDNGITGEWFFLAKSSRNQLSLTKMMFSGKFTTKSKRSVKGKMRDQEGNEYDFSMGLISGQSGASCVEVRCPQLDKIVGYSDSLRIPYYYEDADPKFDEYLRSMGTSEQELLSALQESGFQYIGVKPTVSQTEEDKTEYIFPHSSETYVFVEDLQKLSEWECRVALNEIYARHGRRFKNKELQEWFDSCSWYNGTIAPEDFQEDVLSDIEKDNIITIQTYNQRW